MEHLSSIIDVSVDQSLTSNSVNANPNLRQANNIKCDIPSILKASVNCTMRKYNLVVIGAGTGGCIAARTGAQKGYDVCLIDVKSRKDVGDKVCGDAIARHHFNNLGIDSPKGDELEGSIKGIEVYSPDGETVFHIEGGSLHGFTINRHLFGQRLLNEAIDSGAELLDRTLTQNPILKDGYVRGVRVKDLETGNEYDVLGDVTIDASGVAAVLRKSMPQEWGLEREVRGEDLSVCYREIRTVKPPNRGPECLKIFLGQKVSPGGYVWIFPKGENIVNVGIGLQMVERFPSPKGRLYTHVLTKSLFEGSTVIKAGGGIVPTRRPIDCMVGNGVMFVGDVACQPNPIHGGGIGPSMVGGKLAAQTACKAMDDEDVSMENLWPYNVEFMRSYGARSAGLDVFRLFLTKCDDDSLNYGMRHTLITERDILMASLGDDLRLNITEKAERVFRGLGRLPFLRGLNRTAKLMGEIRRLYQNYPPPQPEEVRRWARKVSAIIAEMGKVTF